MAFLNLFDSIRPVFRHPDKLQVLPFRDWIRANLPVGNQGFVAEDLDLVIRVYGANFDSDSTGKFLLAELKYGNSRLDYAQRMTFGLLDSMLRQADPTCSRYLGFFLINYSDVNWDKARFKINGQAISHDELLELLCLVSEIKPYSFN
jgi:hypothetical protein